MFHGRPDHTQLKASIGLCSTEGDGQADPATEVPCNAILHRYFRNRPSIWMGSLCIGWGIVMTLHGIVQNFVS